MHRFRTKLSNIFQHLLPKNIKFQTSHTTTIHKLSLLTACMFFIPKYIHLATLQSNNDSAQQSHVQQHKQTQQEHEQKKQQIINIINTNEDAQKLNLAGNIVIWFQATGVDYIDQQVIILLRKFVNERYHSITCPFKIIIDRTTRSKNIQQSSYYKKPVQLIIIKSQDIKPISLSRYLSYQNTSDLHYYTLFQRLTTEINEFKQINISNLHQFVQGLGNRSYQTTIIMNAPHDNIKIRKAKKGFKHFIQDKQIITANTNKVIVTDQFASKYLGLPEYKKDGENIYVMVPESENVVQEGLPSLIHNQRFFIYQPYLVNKSLVLPPYLQKSTPDSFLLKIHADLNQNVSLQLSKLYENLKKSDKYPQLSSIPKLLIFNTVNDAKPIQITIQKNNFDQIVNVYSPDCRYSTKQKNELLYQGRNWKFQQQQITVQALQQWVSNVVHHKIQPYFENQKLENEKIKQNSTRITGQEYYEILHTQIDKAKVILHYSQHCFSCKKFKPVYEQIAGQKKDKYNFYRIDNDFNRSKSVRNYNSTPIFAFYKNGHTFLYKSNIFTKSLFQNFLEITNNLKIIDEQKLENIVADRLQNQFKLSDFV